MGAFNGVLRLRRAVLGNPSLAEAEVILTSLLWLLMAGQGQTPNPAWDVHIDDCKNVDGFIECEPKPWIMKREADSGNPPQRVEQQVRFGVGCKDGAPCDMQPPTAVVSEPIPGPTERISDNLTRQTRTCKVKSDFLLQDSGGTWRCVNLGKVVGHPAMAGGGTCIAYSDGTVDCPKARQ